MAAYCRNRTRAPRSGNRRVTKTTSEAASCALGKCKIVEAALRLQLEINLNLERFEF